MKLTFNAMIILDIKDPDKYGYPEPTIKSLIEIINKKECKAGLASELFIDPIIIFEQVTSEDKKDVIRKRYQNYIDSNKKQ